MPTIDLGRRGPWKELFGAALRLTDHLRTVIANPAWSFGGGTVLMLRLNHRRSKDIDLFVPDPQYLGYVNPRLSDVAEAVTGRYVEAAESLKLLLPGGEIDFVVGSPLTEEPWEEVQYEGQTVRVESNAEIISKKMHFRGHHSKARDLFDLCAVAEYDPHSIAIAAPFLARHATTFITGLKDAAPIAREEFRQIDRLAYKRSFDDCLALAEDVLLHALRKRARKVR